MNRSKRKRFSPTGECLERRDLLSTLQLLVAGTAGDETLDLIIDETMVASYQLQGTAQETLEYSSDQDFTADRIRVAFTNDGLSATNTDRNLIVDKLVLDGKTFQTEHPSTFSNGSYLESYAAAIPGRRQTEWLVTDGFFQFTNQSATTINVLAAGATGIERMQLTLDGRLLREWTVGTESAIYSVDVDEIVDLEAGNTLRIGLADSSQGQQLTVDRIEINEIVIETEASDTFTQRVGSSEAQIIRGYFESEVLQSEGYLQFASPPSTVVVRASGDEGTERFQLQVNETSLASFDTTTSPEKYTFIHDAPLQASDLRIVFDNDTFDSTAGIESNLNVDYLELDGQRIETESPFVFSNGTYVSSEQAIVPGYGLGETLNSNGYFQFAAGSVVDIRAKGDTGLEDFDLFISNKPVGKFSVEDQFGTIRYVADKLVNAHDVRIEFNSNELLPGETEDRNLTVDYIEIDGIRFETEDDSTYSAGTGFVNGAFQHGFGHGESLFFSNSFFQFQGVTINDDSFSIPEDSISVPLAVLNNDTTSFYNQLRLAAVGAPEHGRVTINGDVVEYTPSADFVGTDTFTYTIASNNGSQALLEATVSVEVNQSHQQPQSLLNPQVAPELTPSGKFLEVERFAKLPLDAGGRQPRMNALTTYGNRIFVVTDGRVQGTGEIYELITDENGKTTANLFLDVGSAVFANTGLNIDNSNPLFGLRSVAFHPEFAINGKFYTAYTGDRPSDPSLFYYLSDPPNPVDVESVLAEWTFDFETGEVDPLSHRTVFRVGMIALDHAIRGMTFNPFARPGDEDYGLLYIGHGDGSEQSAIAGDGQNGDALGKILRINPLQSGELPFSNPPTNPFVDSISYPSEVYALGFRNPTNLSFAQDAAGEVHLIATEIGRDNIEEINIVRPGQNYGWADREGVFIHEAEQFGINGNIANLPDDEAQNSFIYPNVIFGHEGIPGESFVGQAITGSHVVQNGSTELAGQFIFAEFATDGRAYHVDFESLLGQTTSLDAEDPEFDSPDDLTWLTPQELTILFDHDSDDATPPLARSSLKDVLDDEPDFERIPSAGKLRADLRLGQGPAGELYVLNKRNGWVYLATNTVGTQVNQGEAYPVQSSYSLNETNGTLKIDLIRVGGAAGELVVDFETVEQSATAGSDFVATSGTLTFADGELAKSVTITLLDDSKIESLEHFSLRITNLNSDGSAGPTSLSTIELRDTDLLNVEKATIRRNDTFTVSFNEPPSDIQSWVIDWGDGRQDSFSADTTSALYRYVDAPGDYTISLSGIDNSGNTIENLQRSTITVTAASPAVVDRANSGFSAEFFESVDFSGTAVAQRIDPRINFDFGIHTLAPFFPENGDYSVRWRGQITADFSAPHTFHTTTGPADQIRLSVGGQTLVDTFSNSTSIPQSGTIELEAGESVEIVLEYIASAVAGSRVILEWENPFWFRETIPAESVSPMTPFFPNGYTVDRWDDLQSEGLASLTTTDRYIQNLPNATFVDTLPGLNGGFVAAGDTGEYSGIRRRGIVVAQETGTHRFYLAGSGQAELLMSPDVNSANLITLASAMDSPPDDYTFSDIQESVDVFLTAGQSFYIETIQVATEDGPNHLSVAWSIPSDNDIVPLPIEVIRPVRPVVSIHAERSQANEAAGYSQGLRYAVSRTDGFGSDLDVHYTVGGTAENGIDFQALSGVVTIAAGESSTFIDIEITDDMLPEGAEEIVLRLVATDDYWLVLESETQVIGEISGEISAPTTSILPADAVSLGNISFTTGDADFSNFEIDTPLPGSNATTGLRINVNSFDNVYDVRPAWQVNEALEDGQSLVISLFARADVSLGERGRLTVRYEQQEAPFDGGQGEFSVTDQWQQFILPFTATRSLPASEWRIDVRAGHSLQTVEIADMRAVIVDNAELTTLPTTKINYGGRDRTSDWREDLSIAETRYRKQPVSLTFVDASDNVLSGAQVSLTPIEPEFQYGTAIRNDWITGGADSFRSDADAQRYQSIVAGLFDRVTDESQTQWGPYLTDPQQAQLMAQFAEDNELGYRGHSIVWGQFDGAATPSFLFAEYQQRLTESETDATEWLKGQLLEHAANISSDLAQAHSDGSRPLVSEWDVINHPVEFTAIWEIVGNEFMAEVLATAAENAHPDTRHFLNENRVLVSPFGGRDDDLFDLLSLLESLDAPLDAIGFQGHFESTQLPAIENIISDLARFRTFGHDYALTELDVERNGLDAQGQADFFRDILQVAAGTPEIGSVGFWGFWENSHWKSELGAHWVNSDWSLTPAAQSIIDALRSRSRTYYSRPDGSFSGAIKNGDYLLTVTLPDGRKIETDISITDGGYGNTITFPAPTIRFDGLGDESVDLEIRDAIPNTNLIVAWGTTAGNTPLPEFGVTLDIVAPTLSNIVNVDSAGRAQIQVSVPFIPSGQDYIFQAFEVSALPRVLDILELSIAGVGVSVQQNNSHAPTITGLESYVGSTGEDLEIAISSESFSDPDSSSNVLLTSRLPNGNPLPDWITFDPHDLRYKIADDAPEGVLELSITAIDHGAPLRYTSKNFSISLQPQANVWTNSAEPLDTTNDDRISLIDALSVLNHLNRDGSGQLPHLRNVSASAIDVNGDMRATPLDALLILNHLNKATLVTAFPEFNHKDEESTDIVFAELAIQNDNETQSSTFSQTRNEPIRIRNDNSTSHIPPKQPKRNSMAVEASIALELDVLSQIDPKNKS